MSERLTLSSLGTQIKTNNPNQIRVNCIFCDDQKFHLYIHLRKGVYICHKCKSSGRIEGLERPIGSLESLKQRVSEKFNPTNAGLGESANLLRLPEEYLGLSPSAGIPYRYLKNRGVTLEEIKRYNIGYCSEGTYAERIILPVYDQNKLIYYTARSYTNRTPRYLNAKVNKRGAIFTTFKGGAKIVVIVEGIFGALRISKLLPSIALLGKGFTYEQVVKISNRIERAIIYLDPDAHKEGHHLSRGLGYLIKTKLIFSQKPPDELSWNDLKVLAGIY